MPIFVASWRHYFRESEVENYGLICRELLRLFSAASDDATAERRIQNGTFSSFCSSLWKVASPVMDRFAHSLRLLLEDQICLAL